MGQPLISFKDFSFRYDSQSEPTLKDINLNIYPNEKILILGPSGSGKSTFGHCLNGLIPNAFHGEYTGEAIIQEEVLPEHTIGELSYKVGTVLQDTSAQFVGLTVAEDVAFALENDQVPYEKMHVRVSEWIDKMNLSAIQRNAPQDLSGGQKQRVSMAGVLIDQPEILLFDEPLASLDPASGYETMALINEMQAQLGNTIIIIEHRLEDVLSQPMDRVLVFDEGRIIFDDSPDTLLKSDILARIGVREPLYLSAAKYAGVKVEEMKNTDSLSEINASDLKAKVQSWYQALKFDEPQKLDEILLRLNEVNFMYPRSDRKTLDSISFEIKKGEMVSIVGTNGAGKTTLAKLIAGFLTPSAGNIYLEGDDITYDRIGYRANRIGYVMQDPNQMISQHLIFDEVALGLRMRHFTEEEVEKRVYEALKICGLYSFREWPISALSYGQKKRVTIASILVLEPELLILDEPTAGQDYYHYTEFMQFIRSLNRKGLTIMMITHDLQLMLEYTDRTLTVNDGKILADKTPFEILTSQNLTKQSSLRPTSLYYFAERMGIDNPTQFVQNFIRYERKVKANE